MPEKNSPGPPHIEWFDENTATGELAEFYREWKTENDDRAVPGILKCFSQRPETLRKIIELSDPLHFQDGHLSRRIKEMIATYVSGLNRCLY
jgi:hypothetical protein